MNKPVVGAHQGVQQIISRVGARWRNSRQTAECRDDGEDRLDTPDREPARPPPALGTGKLVDRLV